MRRRRLTSRTSSFRWPCERGRSCSKTLRQITSRRPPWTAARSLVSLRNGGLALSRTKDYVFMWLLKKKNAISCCSRIQQKPCSPINDFFQVCSARRRTRCGRASHQTRRISGAPCHGELSWRTVPGPRTAAVIRTSATLSGTSSYRPSWKPSLPSLPIPCLSCRTIASTTSCLSCRRGRSSVGRPHRHLSGYTFTRSEAYMIRKTVASQF